MHNNIDKLLFLYYKYIERFFMAGSINKVILIGSLGRDPEARAMQNGNDVVTLNVATSESWKDKNGERKEKTEWHKVVIFSDGLAKVAKNYLRKGSKVYIEGKLTTRKWQDKDGKDNYTTEIVLQGYDANLTILDGFKDKDDKQQDTAPDPSEVENEDWGDRIPF